MIFSNSVELYLNTIQLQIRAVIVVKILIFVQSNSRASFCPILIAFYQSDIWFESFLLWNRMLMFTNNIMFWFVISPWWFSKSRSAEIRYGSYQHIFRTSIIWVPNFFVDKVAHTIVPWLRTWQHSQNFYVAYNFMIFPTTWQMELRINFHFPECRHVPDSQPNCVATDIVSLDFDLFCLGRKILLSDLSFQNFNDLRNI